MVQRPSGDFRTRPLGRDGLVEQVRAWLDAPSRVACLVGDPGMGKTNVWAEVVAQPTSQVAARVVCAEAESGLSWVVASEVISAVESLGGSVALPPLQRQVAEVVTLREPPQTLPILLEPQLVGATLTSLLRLRHGPPTIVAVDDLQWCDSDSFAALSFAVRRCADLPVAWLCTRRTDSENALPRERVFTVGPLDDLDLRQIVAAHLGRHLPAPLLAEVARVSGGNPLHALEIVRALPPDAAAEDVLTSPGLRQLIGQRIIGVPAPTRNALLDVAVRAGVPLTYPALDDLDAAFDAGIVALSGKRVHFTHPLLAAAVVNRAAPGALRAAHRRAAADQADPVMRARHLTQAAGGPDEHLAGVLDDAVKVAEARGDSNSAAWLSHGALELTSTALPPWDRLAAAARNAAATSDPRALEGQTAGRAVPERHQPTR